MNTAQLSVLPDDLAAVSLTPLRRAVQRVRTFGTLPGKWPFPPAATDVAAPAAGNVVRGPRERSLGNATVEPVSDQVSVKSMVVDVVLVLAWGAMIPALMWLGAAGGF
ncbi:hypothetical protein LMG3458_00474 [Achromobacter deleyi]|uniref:Uncharacterized protein n=1 Tax=Achromobacter deleyi TaxID=1353891 RepID=A0A6S6Z445_9BURK|nr:hypothetical protein [Achromobacter deleyi]CAB3658811.1 hypothetical protein LMG3458_00474 [Achromobacter deleyi]CAB3894547.1 hypothetical protein LMG3481_03947 [Achromobacter deleyi]CAB3920295.1 hypothetical protein LMG3482_05359 [Achromobacter deleyi]